MSNHSEVELVVDPNQDELEAHFSETILHLLKEKLGQNSKARLKNLTRDRSFQYSCPCPFHDDGKNPNGRIALETYAGPRLYCNSCSKTWFIQNLLEETGQSSGDLWASVRETLLTSKKDSRSEAENSNTPRLRKVRGRDRTPQVRRSLSTEKNLE